LKVLEGFSEITRSLVVIDLVSFAVVVLMSDFSSNRRGSDTMDNSWTIEEASGMIDYYCMIGYFNHVQRVRFLKLFLFSLEFVEIRYFFFLWFIPFSPASVLILFLHPPVVLSYVTA
jgi:hypothetical protein